MRGDRAWRLRESTQISKHPSSACGCVQVLKRRVPSAAERHEAPLRQGDSSHPLGAAYGTGACRTDVARRCGAGHRGGADDDGEVGAAAARGSRRDLPVRKGFQNGVSADQVRVHVQAAVQTKHSTQHASLGVVAIPPNRQQAHRERRVNRGRQAHRILHRRGGDGRHMSSWDVGGRPRSYNPCT